MKNRLDNRPSVLPSLSSVKSTPNPADAGCNSQLAQYSNTPILHHSAWPDSRTRTRTRTRTKRLTRIFGAPMASEVGRTKRLTRIFGVTLYF